MLPLRRDLASHPASLQSIFLLDNTPPLKANHPFTLLQQNSKRALLCFDTLWWPSLRWGRQTIEEIRKVFKANWHIKGRATVCEIWDPRHLMIILDSEEDAKVALTSPLRKVGHAMFRLFRYTPDYNPKKESSTTTKWYVRACVEVDVTKPIPDEVRITLSDGRVFWQQIEVEGNLSYCGFCKVHGHTLIECRKRKPLATENTNNIQVPNKYTQGKDGHRYSNNETKRNGFRWGGKKVTKLKLFP
ncbi:hypothetical protein QQ045_004173 [Rhodiola kirilowii]